MKKRVLALVLALAMVACLSGCDADDSAQVRPLEGEHEQYYTMHTRLLAAQAVSGEIESDSTVTVYFAGTQGPTRMLVEVQHREAGASEWSEFEPVYLELNESQDYDIPARHELAIYATACEGQSSGDVTFRVTLN